LELNSKQFAILEKYRFQACSGQLHHRKITIDELAIHKSIVREITIREITVLENAVFKLPIVDFFVRKRYFFERFMRVYEVFH